MLAAHDELIPAVSDRVTVLHLGGALDDEARDLYLRLAGSAVPLSADDTDALRLLAEWCVGRIGLTERARRHRVRESRAVINAARLRAGLPPLVTTVTDVLRLACELSGGDVSLREPTRFRSLRRRERDALLAALDAVLPGAGRTEARRRRPVRRTVEAAGRAASPARVPALPAGGRGVRGGPGRGRRAVVRRPGGGGVCAIGRGPGRSAAADRPGPPVARRPTGCSAPPRTRPPRTPPRWRWSWRPSPPPRPTCPAGCCCPSASTCRTGPSRVPAGCSPTGSAARGPRRTGGTPWTGASSPRSAP